MANVKDEYYIKHTLKENPPLGLFDIKIEKYIANKTRRVDMFAKDSEGLVVIEIKAGREVAGMDELNQILNYRQLVEKEYSIPTKGVLLANKFTPLCAKCATGKILIYSMVEDDIMNGVHFVRRGNIRLVKPNIKQPIKINLAQVYLALCKYIFQSKLTEPLLSLGYSLRGKNKIVG